MDILFLVMEGVSFHVLFHRCGACLDIYLARCSKIPQSKSFFSWAIIFAYHLRARWLRRRCKTLRDLWFIRLALFYEQLFLTGKERHLASITKHDECTSPDSRRCASSTSSHSPFPTAFPWISDSAVTGHAPPLLSDPDRLQVPCGSRCCSRRNRPNRAL
jgi:hypothetical protein